MIVTQIIGGLGNQMFQYAAGRRLASRHGTELKLDISGFENYTFGRRYELSVFNIAEKIASPEEIRSLTRKTSKPLRLLYRLVGKRAPHPPSYTREKYFHFNPEVLELPDGVYLEGYWQSEKYFREIENTIRSEFTLKLPPQGKNEELIGRITSEDSVSLHVRRGDYVHNSVVSAVHGICGLEYYGHCISCIRERISLPSFYVFSDDIGWARENLRIHDRIFFVDYNDAGNGYEDLRLMSACRHHILANSSFSWWGAWLNPNPDKIVLAPEKWFNAERFDTGDLFPEGWILVNGKSGSTRAVMPS